MTYENYLEKIYYDPKHPASFTGLDKLYRAVRKEGKYVLGKAKIRAWLTKQEAYTVHRGVIRKYKRQKIVVPYTDYQWEIDTAYMTSHIKENDGYGYFLIIIDVISKFVWTFPLKSVTGRQVCEVFQRLLQRGRRPEKLRSDKGSEFKSIVFQKLLNREAIHHFYSLNETKAAVAERAIKTIKSRLTRYVTKRQTRRWIDVLDDVTKSYNQTYNRSIKKAPQDVRVDDQASIWQHRYNTVPKAKSRPKTISSRFRFKIGDNVRISHLRRAFDREYDERWTIEYFTVSERGRKQGIPFYKLVDLEGDAIDGTFYANELSNVLIDERSAFRIEKVLRKRKGQVLVKWMGWPKKFNSWIPKKDVEEYRKNRHKPSK